MHKDEVCNKFCVGEEILSVFEKNGFFDDILMDNGSRDYTDKDIEKLSMLLSLTRIGMTMKDITLYVKLLEEGDISKKERISMLQMQRKHLLDNLHQQQENIDSIDYLIYEMRD